MHIRISCPSFPLLSSRPKYFNLRIFNPREGLSSCMWSYFRPHRVQTWSEQSNLVSACDLTVPLFFRALASNLAEVIPQILVCCGIRTEWIGGESQQAKKACVKVKYFPWLFPVIFAWTEQSYKTSSSSWTEHTIFHCVVVGVHPGFVSIDCSRGRERHGCTTIVICSSTKHWLGGFSIDWRKVPKTRRWKWRSAPKVSLYSHFGHLFFIFKFLDLTEECLHWCGCRRPITIAAECERDKKVSVKVSTVTACPHSVSISLAKNLP